MDDIVKQAMARWPDVPAAWGWLRLDRRGRWCLVDRGAPGFDEALHGEGSPVRHVALNEFIGRNYQCDEQGRWFFQNGPQRVFVDLAAGPWVLRVFQAHHGRREGVAFVTHTGLPAGEVSEAWVDGEGTVWLQTEAGPGTVHDTDLGALPLEDDADGQPVLRLLEGDRPVRPLVGDAGEVMGFVARPRT